MVKSRKRLIDNIESIRAAVGGEVQLSSASTPYLVLNITDRLVCSVSWSSTKKVFFVTWPYHPTTRWGAKKRRPVQSPEDAIAVIVALREWLGVQPDCAGADIGTNTQNWS
jgi:hypothetical protein